MDRTVAPSPLRGGRCPRCVGQLEDAAGGVRCRGCGSAFAAGPYPGTLAFSEVGANFAQALDAEIVPRLIPALDALDPPACSERAIEQTARELGIAIGNPVWEGRADLARLLLPGPDAVALDIGCGFGTFATAVARSAGHVFATDRSPVRVALTAARARAEGLENLTAFETNGVRLPVGDAVCDLVTIIGVLEWAGVGSGDAPAAQRAMLAEVERVLKPGGVLLLGIENRYGGHYFLGAREDHTDLRFSSLLPRRLADIQSRRMRGVPFETPTHSRAALKRLLRDAGLASRVAVVLPSYQQARFAFDEVDARAGLRFYVRHAFHATSTPRRLAGRALLHAPPGWVASLAPSYWAIGTKASAPRPAVPGVITGFPYCDGAIKRIEWSDGRLTATSRRTNEPLRSEALVDGWSARRWASWPLRAAARAARRRWLAGALGAQLGAAADAAPVDRDDVLADAERGLALVAETLPAQTLARCRDALAALPAQLPGAREHGDLILNNVVVAGGELTLVDRPAQERVAAVGRDAAIALLDLCGVESGAKQLDLAAGVEGVERLARADARAIAGLLRAACPGVAGEQLPAALLAGVLRHLAEHRALAGTEPFLAAVADGRFARALARLLR
ncbi:MAG TPA: class I SAM-dependent methyltransferase [Conexibacter sp.]|nr:class I SAM-dependent methyltransferase [Conexibacter sp.]